MLNKSPSAQGPKTIKASSWAFQVMTAYTCPAARTSLIPSRLSSHGTFVVFSFHFSLFPFCRFLFSISLFSGLVLQPFFDYIDVSRLILPLPRLGKETRIVHRSLSIWDMSPMDDKSSLCIFENPEPQILASQHTQTFQFTQRTWRKNRT